MNPNMEALALGARLRDCRNVRTLGVLANFSAYPPREAAAIRNASKIYYPTRLYAGLLEAIGKAVFPSAANYHCAQDKIRQTLLFQMLGIPHPRTRVFYGRRQKAQIGAQFGFPLVAKIPRGSAMGRGVWRIDSVAGLETYCQREHPAYIQEYLPARRDIRVVVIGRRAVHAYWREAAAGEFRCNLAAGGRVCLDPVPDAAIRLAESTARACGWNDVGIDLIVSAGGLLVLEGNMRYGREGFRRAGISYPRVMERLIDDGEI